MASRRSRRGVPFLIFLAGAALCWGRTASAATPGQMCEAAKLRAAGKEAACRLREMGKAAVGSSPDLAKCTMKASDAFARAEMMAGPGVCPTAGDAGAIEGRVDGAADGINAALSGMRFVDNGDGTVTDNQTGLVWEKKDGADGVADSTDPHDADNFYRWSVGSVGPSGEVFTSFLGTLNDCPSVDGSTVTRGFAGHCDWRLPTIAELDTIVDTTVPGCGGGNACIPAIFGPTNASFYWSSSMVGGNSSFAWGVNFFVGGPASTLGYKTSHYSVRAVRGGP